MEIYRVGQVMDKFMYHFQRGADEEVLDHNTKFDKEINQVEKVAGELAPTWKAHLYLTKMKLREDKMSQVLTGALGRYTVDALRQSALAAFPTLGAIRGASAPAQDRLGFNTWGKRSFKKKGPQAHEEGQYPPP